MGSDSGLEAREVPPGLLPEHERYARIWRMLDEGLGRDEIARRIGFLPHDADYSIRYLKAMAAIIARGRAKGRTANKRMAGAGGGRGRKSVEVAVARDAEIWRLAGLGWHRQRIARHLGLSCTTVGNRDRVLLAIADLVEGERAPAPKTRGDRRREARDERIRELKGLGWRTARIAQHMGLSMATVQAHLLRIRFAWPLAPRSAGAAQPAARGDSDAADPPGTGGARSAGWLERAAPDEGSAGQYLRRRTEREIRIWRMSFEGLTSPRIAECLGVSTNTVRRQLGYLRTMRRVMVEAAAGR